MTRFHAELRVPKPARGEAGGEQKKNGLECRCASRDGHKTGLVTGQLPRPPRRSTYRRSGALRADLAQPIAIANACCCSLIDCHTASRHPRQSRAQDYCVQPVVDASRLGETVRRQPAPRIDWLWLRWNGFRVSSQPARQPASQPSSPHSQHSQHSTAQQ
ncbi:hypothetical protein BS50DRAFT_572108 [Corynespora cassiicola Philippines]|uniref:Uncharacterized protein n=1 Tax=Corynespora cassiicola Philippines TaxID=1448308 RepID=A0A2T2NU28_CORCC|nr:hypothetical protein BS50DRAFT_572108 [Corynespora cassiicola Philippines]